MEHVKGLCIAAGTEIGRMATWTNTALKKTHGDRWDFTRQANDTTIVYRSKTIYVSPIPLRLMHMISHTILLDVDDVCSQMRRSHELFCDSYSHHIHIQKS